jgi:hypothetical protein
VAALVLGKVPLRLHILSAYVTDHWAHHFNFLPSALSGRKGGPKSEPKGFLFGTRKSQANKRIPKIKLFVFVRFDDLNFPR